MVFKVIPFLIVLCALAFPTNGAFAKLSGEKAEHARSAFAFSDRKDWDNAISHAKKTGDDSLIKLMKWQYYLDADSGASFGEITSFIDANPNWPEQKRLNIRAEMALRNDDVRDNDVIAWFSDNEPITGVGKIALAEAMKRNHAGSSDKIKTLIRDGWKNGDFDESQEKKILDKHDDVLTTDDHKARIDRLLWEERIAPAKRILNLVPATHQKLYKARMAFIDDKRMAIIALAQVPSSLKNDAGLIYNRMVFRAHRDDDDGVRELLLIAPEKPPYPEKWWKYREAQIRMAVDEKNFSLAKKLLAKHGQTEGSGLADALWIEGWLKTEFLNQPKDALDIFDDMYDKVKFPVSKSRAAYWAGRAAEKSGDSQRAESWYKKAAAFPTTFYGQLGSLEHKGNSPLSIPSSPSVSSQDRNNFEYDDFIKAIKLTIEMEEYDFARRLITLAVENSDDPSEVTLVTELGAKSGRSSLSVRAAKKALQQNIVLVDGGYPTPKTPSGVGLERALTLAITRQESEFDPNARSPANALGMMQLLPRTAKEVAKKNGMAFSQNRLSEPSYNMALGSHYLARLISGYDGSYILGIAAYNAGPGNVRKWIKRFGSPGSDVIGAVNWIEKIPFSETRNYVQRVMENLQVYRAIDAEDKPNNLQLAEDLKR